MLMRLNGRRALRGRAGGCEEGVAAVEMALVMPLLLLLVFGIIEFGFIFNRYITVTHAAREGVRLLSIGESSSTATSAAEGSGGSSGASFGSTPISCSASSSGTIVGTVKMSCSSTYGLRLLDLLPLPDAVPLTSEARMRKE